MDAENIEEKKLIEIPRWKTSRHDDGTIEADYEEVGAGADEKDRKAKNKTKNKKSARESSNS